ncbi:MAG: hypothetical protein E6J34_22545 [Chloroflexi bacterium]|nr:MAG: hypothetical protein E6J34_22545 [Chloroflexota bacterium]
MPMKSASARVLRYFPLLSSTSNLLAKTRVTRWTRGSCLKLAIRTRILLLEDVTFSAVKLNALSFAFR